MPSAPSPIRAWTHPHHPSVGIIGQPTSTDPLHEIHRAEQWLRQQGCQRARGPMEGNTWMPYRANLGPNERPIFLGEPTANAEPWLAAGYSPCMHYSTLLVAHGAQIKATRGRDQQLRSLGWKLLPLHDLPSFSWALEQFHALSRSAFADNFSYTPLSLQDFQQLYAPMQQQLVPELVLMAQNPAGNTAGFCFSYPDVQNPSLKQVIIKTLAVHPSEQKQGIGGWMVGETHRIAEQMGLVGGGLHALMAQHNLSQQISRQKGDCVRRYALYERAL